MARLLADLTRRDNPVDQEAWRSFVDRLHARRLLRGEAAAVLASLSTALPDTATLIALLDVLDERRTGQDPAFPDTVNIVGTGGGPRTFNISTAAAMVAAAIGVRVIKTGSRAYTSRFGSFDLLDRLGIGLAASAEETAEHLDRHGVAFAGYWAYPPEIDLLTREILPLDLRAVGRVVNTIGPFLTHLPFAAQLTGYSRPADLPTLSALAARTPQRRTWLCGNSLGADELVSVTDNVIHLGAGDDITVGPGILALHPGTLDDLAPNDLDLVGHFRAVVSGLGSAAATETVCLNAAALAMLAGTHTDWPSAIASARLAITGGAVIDLIDRMRVGERVVSHG